MREKHSFEKQPSFVHKLFQALKNMNEMHEYEMKCFSKTQVLNPVFPKLRFSNIFPLKISNIEYVLHKKNAQSNFKFGWSDQKTHTITCIVFSKD